MALNKVLTLFGAVGILLIAVGATSGADLFGYREDPEDNPSRQNARNRTPVYIPGRCGLNEILYPGDQESDWVCDCRPAHVYHPASHGCYPLYTQAYCAEGEYVRMPLGAKLPECVPNTCPSPQVPFEGGKCVQLHKNNAGICPTINRIKYVVGVNETTLQLECIGQAPLNLIRLPNVPGHRVSPEENGTATETNSSVQVAFPTAMLCAPGSAAQINGLCMKDTGNDKST